jgi:hypothetical protein
LVPLFFKAATGPLVAPVVLADAFPASTLVFFALTVLLLRDDMPNSRFIACFLLDMFLSLPDDSESRIGVGALPRLLVDLFGAVSGKSILVG